MRFNPGIINYMLSFNKIKYSADSLIMRAAICFNCMKTGAEIGRAVEESDNYFSIDDNVGKRKFRVGNSMVIACMNKNVALTSHMIYKYLKF